MLEAQIVATERFLEQTADERTSEPAGVREELAAQRAAVQQYRDAIATLRQEIETAQLQVGVGDSRYRDEDALRRRYADVVARERSLGGVRRPEVDALLTRIQRMEGALVSRRREIDDTAARRLVEVRRIVDEEAAHLVVYRRELAVLEGETEEVISVVAYENFEDVRHRFYDLVLRADVGRIDVAWAEREEHRLRVDMLTRERTREIGALDDEFADIMDTAAEEAAQEEGSGRTPGGSLFEEDEEGDEESDEEGDEEGDEASDEDGDAADERDAGDEAPLGTDDSAAGPEAPDTIADVSSEGSEAAP